MLMVPSTETETARPHPPGERTRAEALGLLSGFRADFYGCLAGYRDALFELTDALLCADGPVGSLVELTLAAEHRRNHGGMYKALNRGEMNIIAFKAICPVQVGERTLLASAAAEADATVRLWDPATGQPAAVLTGHTDWVNAVCPVRVGGKTLLASACDDRTVRLWDPATGISRGTIPVHHEATALAFLPDRLLAVGLSVGILTISFA